MTATTEVESLLNYAATADIGSDPLVIDLATALTRATNKLADIEDLMQKFRDGAKSGDVLLDIDVILHA